MIWRQVALSAASNPGADSLLIDVVFTCLSRGSPRCRLSQLNAPAVCTHGRRRQPATAGRWGGADAVRLGAAHATKGCVDSPSGPVAARGRRSMTGSKPPRSALAPGRHGKPRLSPSAARFGSGGMCRRVCGQSLNRVVKGVVWFEACAGDRRRTVAGGFTHARYRGSRSSGTVREERRAGHPGDG